MNKKIKQEKKKILPERKPESKTVWWDALEDWEKKWSEKKKEEQKEEARLLGKAEKEYERFSRSMRVLEPAPESIPATQTTEPGWSKMRLRGMDEFAEKRPFGLKSLDYERHPLIRLTPALEEGQKLNPCQSLAYSLRKALEFQTNEKINAILEELEGGEFLIKALDGAEFIPLCRIFPSPYQGDQIVIEVQRSSFPYFHGYSFSIEDVVYHYLTWLQQS